MGWLLLLVALAVPAVFFYNWWTKMQKPSAMEANGGKAEGMFGSARSGAPANPIRRKTAQPPPGQAAKSGGVASSSPTTSGAGMAPGVNAEAGSGQPAPVAPAVPASETGAPMQRKKATPPSGGVRGKVLEYNPNTNRDPTLSILDIKMIKILEEQRMEALRPPPPPPEKKVARQPPPPPRPTAPPVWKQINVQGIISTPNGRAAIVNDEVRYLGDSVLNAEIKKITGSTVIFRYKGQTFYKRVQ
ncbi:MAG: hypothetical protein ABIJ96_12455 [Elusimicrobiota bacterium]